MPRSHAKDDSLESDRAARQSEPKKATNRWGRAARRLMDRFNQLGGLVYAEAALNCRPRSGIPMCSSTPSPATYKARALKGVRKPDGFGSLAQVGDVVHDLLHSIIIMLDARHGNAGESTVGYGVTEANNAVNGVLIFIDEVAL